MEKGEKAPDFEVEDSAGRPVKLSDLLEGGPVVLFFYPAAMTPGCTKETCHFRDLESEFVALGAQPVGISGDKIEKQAEFSNMHDVNFPLLVDSSHAVAKAFGAKRLGVPWYRRMTFVIDADRSVVEVIRDEADMDTHADSALAALRALQA